MMVVSFLEEIENLKLKALSPILQSKLPPIVPTRSTPKNSSLK